MRTFSHRIFGLVLSGLALAAAVAVLTPRRAAGGDRGRRKAPAKRQVVPDQADRVPRGAGGAGGAGQAAPEAHGPGGGPAPEARRLEGHKDIAWGVAFSPAADGPTRGLLLSGGGGRFVPFGDGGDFIGVGWEPGSDFALRLWDPRSGQEVRRFEGGAGLVADVAWSPDGTRVAAGDGKGTVRVWDAASGELVVQIDAHGGEEAWALEFCPDGAHLVSGGRDGTLRLWELKTGKEVRRFEGAGGWVWDLAVSPDGNTVAACDGGPSVGLWDVRTGKRTRTLWGHVQTAIAVAFSPDGTRVLSAGWDNVARLHDAKTGEQLRTFEGHANRVEGVAFAPDGRRVATGSLDQTVRVWDVATGEELYVLAGPEAPVADVAFSADGRAVACGSWDGVVRVWEVTGWNLVAAWQVLPESYQPGEEFEGKVTALVTQLGDPDFRRRQAASRELADLGERAVPLLLALDPARLDAEQRSRLKRVTAGHERLSEERRAELRGDLDFLVDCLESEEPAVRDAALARLREVAGDDAVAGFDPGADAEQRRGAAGKLRESLRESGRERGARG